MAKTFILTWFAGFLDQDIASDAMVWSSPREDHTQPPRLFIDDVKRLQNANVWLRKEVPLPMPLPQLDIVDSEDQTVSLKIRVAEMQYLAGRYLSAQPNGSIDINRISVRDWERFFLVPEWAYDVIVRYTFLNTNAMAQGKAAQGNRPRLMGQNMLRVGTEIYRMSEFLKALNYASAENSHSFELTITDINGTINLHKVSILAE